MHDSKLNSWLIKEKKNITQCLAKCGSFIPRINQDIIENVNQFNEYAEREVSCLVDYIRLYFAEEKEEYKALYIGERLKMAYDVNCSANERKERLVEFMNRDKAVFLSSQPQENKKYFNQVANFFDEIISEFNKPIVTELRVLFIGDCIHTDVMGSLSVLIMRYGAALSPRMISTKNIFQLHKELENLKDQKFDAVFYSPLSYEYNLKLSTTLNYRNLFMNGFELAEIIADVFSQIESVIDRMLTTFDSPIFIHNTACVIRDESNTKLRIKSILTRRLRKHTTEYIDKKLRAYIESNNSSTFKQLFLINELSLLRKNSLYELGKYIYRSALQHPTKFGMLIAHEYDRILFVLTHLISKKLIVCDLDNTLWDGVIGEGEVSHFIERQEILSKLKSKGVLLAINSKNDPSNIHWKGGLLSSNDFVYESINWEPKINAFSKMQSTLNLKTKDFVFIDDRPDEIDFVRSAYPAIQCLDATNSDTWSLFELWESILDSDGSMDRTQVYKEREQRGSFLNTVEIKDIDEAEMFKSLDLILSLKNVNKSELKRIVELINRTNQFNMRGSRTSFTEAKHWLDAEKFTVIQASMSDKFGSMGVVSVLVYEQKENSIDILVFVLSCRVFGYKVDVAILNEIKRQARQMGVQSIRGEYIATASNLPCSLVYSDAMFSKKENYWEYPVNIDIDIDIYDPVWLKLVLD